MFIFYKDSRYTVIIQDDCKNVECKLCKWFFTYSTTLLQYKKYFVSLFDLYLTRAITLRLKISLTSEPSPRKQRRTAKKTINKETTPPQPSKSN